MPAYAVAQLFTTNWIARFNVTDVITAPTKDDSSSRICSKITFDHLQNSALHSNITVSPSGQRERFHRTPNSALTTHESPQRSVKLPIVLLALRSTVKAGVE